MIDVNKNPSPRELFWFAVLLAIFLGGVGTMLYGHFQRPAFGYAAWGLGLVLLSAFAAMPRWRVPIYLGWIYLFYPLGWVLSHVVLALVYYVVLTPIGLGMRLFGRDPMTRRWEPARTSYWIEREPVTDASRYFRQF